MSTFVAVGRVLVNNICIPNQIPPPIGVPQQQQEAVAAVAGGFPQQPMLSIAVSTAVSEHPSGKLIVGQLILFQLTIPIQVLREP